MEFIEFFQAFENLTDRTFRSRFLGRQDAQKPEVGAVERGNA
jgi:hypothetical protein